jgi:hypothetical protein
MVQAEEAFSFDSDQNVALEAAPPPTSLATPARGGGGALRARSARHGSRLNK